MTNREKYDAFRKLYTGSDPGREDHRRFDKLVRLLLDLPETDATPFKVGEFVWYAAAVFRVVAIDGEWVTIRNSTGDDFRRRASEVAPIPAFNQPIDEGIPF